MNVVSLYGRLCADPEVRHGNSGVVVAGFTLAVNRRFAKEGMPSADFIRCVAFGKTAELIEQYFHKGKEIVLTGHIQTGSYDKDDGTKVYTTDVVVDSFDFIGKKDDDGGASEPSEKKETKPATKGKGKKDSNVPEGFEELDDSDLPF